MPASIRTYQRNTEPKKLDMPVLISGTLKIMAELTTLLMQEIDVVKLRKTVDLAPLLKQKQRLTMDYRSNMKSIAAQPDILKNVSEEVRNVVRAAAQKLAEMVDINAKTLRTAITATQRLIQDIVSIVKKEVLTKPGYKNPNTAHMALGTYSPTCQSITVNRTA